MPAKRILACIFAAALTLAGPSAAGAAAITLTTVGTQSGYANLTVGYEFSVTGNQTLTALGAYDSGRNGLNVATPVGLWDDDGNLLLSATVPAGTAGLLDGYFRYVDATYTLLSGEHYVLGLLVNPNDLTTTLNFYQGGTGTVDPAVTIIEARQYTPAMPGLAYPSTRSYVPGSMYLGPNFLFGTIDPIPEPVTGLLLLSGLLGLAALRRRGA